MADAFSGATSGSDETDRPWSQVAYVTAPAGRIQHTAVSTGSEVIIYGGLTGGVEPGVSSDGGVYSLSDRAWTRLAALEVDGSSALGKRFGHCAAWTGSRMLVFGGQGESELLSGGLSFDPSAGAWEQLPSAGEPAPRLWPSCVWTGTVFVVWGGIAADSTGGLASGGIYDPAAGSWRQISGTGSPLHVGSMFGLSHAFKVTEGDALREKVLFWNSLLGRGAVYDVLADAWTDVSAVGAPSARFGQAQHASGTMLVLWGGLSATDGSALTDGSVLEVSTGIWRPVPTVAAPAPRVGGSLALTGDVLRLWGGWSVSDLKPLVVGGSVAVDDASLNSESATWVALETAAAPEPRAFHTAVEVSLSGGDDAMFVWGGTKFFPQFDEYSDIPGALRSQLSQALEQAKARVAEKQAEGEAAFEAFAAGLEAKRDQSFSLVGCAFALAEQQDISELLFQIPFGGRGGIYRPLPRLGSVLVNASVQYGAASSVRASISYDEAEPDRGENGSSDHNCWSPF